jgi:hypothetical protein
MELRPNLQIPAMVKALSEVVLPALDPGDKVALEQGHLVVAMLQLMAQQLPLQYRFDCDELARLVTFSNCIESALVDGATGADVAARLAASTRAATAMLERLGPEPGDILQAINDLREAATTAMQIVFDSGNEGDRTQLIRATLDMSGEQIVRDRSWLIAQGWETDPQQFPPIESLIAPVGRHDVVDDVEVLP